MSIFRDEVKKRNAVSSTARGFTLIETVVCMVLLTVFTLGISLLMEPLTDMWRIQSFQHDTAFEARLALLRMTRDIETIKDRTSISQASSTALTFTDVNNQAVAYSLSSGTLSRNNIPLLKNVSSLQFQYIGLTSAGVDTTLNSPTLSPSSTDIRRISISLTVAANGQTASFRGQVQPRNLY